MPVIIYKMNASPPARAVLATAEVLGLEIETREVSIPNKEQFKPEYLEKNPLHTVPLLEDGNFILADSHAIIIYLASKYGGDKGASLYPSDIQQRSIIHQRLFLDASILFPRLIAIIKAIAYENAASVDEKKTADVEEAYGFLEKYLESSPFLAGEQLTLADISCVTTVSSLNVVVPIDAKFIKLQEWVNNLKSQSWYVNKNEPGLNDLGGFLNFFLKKNAA
ncbi:glutathione S-transferase 1-like [Epargyreus clarus]|uniref:glutathione S-transferase 1-like n=1 Tax=Epargyreus clarus TaxID=520877 RepID=UPI003C2D0EE4